MAAQYDPLGIGDPLLLKGKLLLRKLHVKETSLSWDEALPKERADEWALYIRSLLSLPAIPFPRSLGAEYGKEAWLVGFWDGSLEAHSASSSLACLAA